MSPRKNIFDGMDSDSDSDMDIQTSDFKLKCDQISIGVSNSATEASQGKSCQSKCLEDLLMSASSEWAATPRGD